MAGKRVLILGEKETFLVRSLVKKTGDEAMDCIYVPLDVNEISEKWKDTMLCVLYMDAGSIPSEEVVHFLCDRLNEGDGQLILIGERVDIQVAREMIPEDLIYQVYVRPLNQEEFINAVTTYARQKVTGELKKRILVVDDDANYLNLVRDWLKEDYKVSIVSSGLQAIKWLGKNKADLILLDHEMPITSGPQVLEMLRSDNETKNIPVMFLTGKSDKESVMAVVALRPEGYFLKTITKMELLEKLKEFFILHQ